MESIASNPSMGKETHDAGDDSLNLKIKKLRTKEEEVRQQELNEIRVKHESALKELFFYMNNAISNMEDIEAYTELLQDIDNSKADQIQLRNFLQNNKLEKNWEVDKSSTKLDNTTTQIVTTSNTAELPQPSQQTNTQSQIQSDQTIQTKKKRVSIPTERMVTRAASGAINIKTVDEILKEAERGSGSPTSTTTPRIPVRLNIPQRKQSLQRANILLSEGRHLSSASTGRIDANLARSFDRETIIINFNNSPVYKSLQPPKKAITTSEWRVAIEEVKYARVIERIEELKRLGLWSRKQIEPFRDPPRYKTHWDYLLEEMIWMRTDFREERKQKMKAAHVLALAVQEWHIAEDKSTVCVKKRIPEPRPLTSSPAYTSHENNEIDSIIDIDNGLKSETEGYNTNGHLSQENKWSLSTEDVMIDVESVDDDSSTRIGIDQENVKDNDSIKMPPPIAPHVLQSLRQKVFNLPEDTLICRLEGPDQQVYEVDSIFPDLPVYKPPEPSENDIYFDEIHCYKIMPISKCLWRKPPKEKSNKRRYENEDLQRFKRIKLENEEETNESQYEESTLFTPHTPFEQQIQIRVTAPKKDQDSSAVWYPEDDELLMSLTKKYQYNWDLIADAWNSSRGLITGYERSPWECYLRWTQKDDMSQFIIINHNNENVIVESAVEMLTDNVTDAAALPLSISGINVRPKRDTPKNIQKRDITKPRRNSSLAEAMKRAAKKRADSSQKQLQNRRNHDQPTPILHHVMTPIELSKMKSDQERQLQTALLEQRQAAVLAFQGHRQPMIVRPQANPAMPYLATQTRPQAGMATNQLQAYVNQQRVAAMAAQHRHHPQQLTQSMQHAAQQFYFRTQQAQAQAHVQRNLIPNQIVQQQIAQQQHAVAQRQQQAQMPQQSAQQTQNIQQQQQTQENVD